MSTLAPSLTLSSRRFISISNRTRGPSRCRSTERFRIARLEPRKMPAWWGASDRHYRKSQPAGALPASHGRTDAGRMGEGDTVAAAFSRGVCRCGDADSEDNEFFCLGFRRRSVIPSESWGVESRAAVQPSCRRRDPIPAPTAFAVRTSSVAIFKTASAIKGTRLPSRRRRQSGPVS